MSPLTNYGFGVAMGGLLLKLQNFKKVKLTFGHPVLVALVTGYKTMYLCNLDSYTVTMCYWDQMYNTHGCALVGRGLWVLKLQGISEKSYKIHHFLEPFQPLTYS